MNVTPDQLISAGSYINREWGYDGYVIENIESSTRLVTMFHVRHSDGSRFVVLVDRWGNCGHSDPGESATNLVREMHERAATP